MSLIFIQPFNNGFLIAEQPSFINLNIFDALSDHSFCSRNLFPFEEFLGKSIKSMNKLKK